ncbi:MAG: aminotransferase class V-fold PLP-dependent enzyme, partial [Candidatus Eremiobacteraeota bacterium]|nr:aminotransferase class V-fold PLP-dependent enzyme [Candidatus Eremiobacteraeota bacterium]
MKNLLFIPGPVAVAEPVLAATSKPMIDHRGPEFSELVRSLTERLRPIFGTSNDIVFLGCSGTGGLEAAIASTFSAGETLLACPVGVFGRRLIAIARTYGCNVEVLETELGHALDPQALRRRLSADTERRFDGILLTHNETSTGVQNDMAAIAAVTREHPAITLVDSVSGLGASDFRMDEWQFDIVVSASQKVLAAPPGIAMVAASERAWAKMDAAATPKFYLDLNKAREFAHQGQTPWTPPVSVLFALDASLERF